MAFVRFGAAWYRMNDSIVTQVDQETVLKAQAFMLFYERV